MGPPVLDRVSDWFQVFADAELADFVPQLAGMLRGLEEVLRTIATGAFGRLGPSVVPALLPLLADEDPEVRAHAVIAVGSVGREAGTAVPMLIAALADELPTVRQAAATSLGRIGPVAKPAGPALIRRLESDPDVQVRGEAALALGKLGPAAAVALHVLKRYAEDDEADERVQLSAFQALRMLEKDR